MEKSAMRRAAFYHSRLYKRNELTIVLLCELGVLQEGCSRTAHIRHHAVEHHPFSRDRRRRKPKSARRSGRALPELLAAHFLVCLSTGLFDGGCARSHAGFFFEDIGRSLV